MSYLKAAIADSVHRWFMDHLASCDGHPAEPGFTPECEQLAAQIMADLDWSEIDR